MSQRWLVHSGAEVFGPWSAEEVRSQLRAGRIDAFDLVALEGSSRKRPLVDVDEIFMTAGAKSAQQFSEASQRTESRVIAVPSAIQDNLAIKGKTSNNNPQQMELTSGQSPASTEFRPPRAFEALAAPSLTSATSRVASDASSAPSDRGAGKGGVVRRYVLWIPGQTHQGPFTSKEVLTLWYARKIPPLTLVEKAGTSNRISISNFAAFYERAAPSGIAFVGEARAAAGVLDISTRWLLTAFILGFMVILAALLWRYRSEVLSDKATELYRSLLGDRSDFTNNSDSIELLPDGGIHGRQMGSTDPRSSRGHDGSGQIASSKRYKESLENRRPDNSRANRAQVERVPRRPVPPPRSSGEPRPVTAKAGPVPSPFTDGSVVTLNGYRFNISSLSACELKCKIPMSGPQGSVTAVFFKEAFADVLSRKSSGLFITGTIKRDPATGGVSIFVQSVK